MKTATIESEADRYLVIQMEDNLPATKSYYRNFDVAVRAAVEYTGDIKNCIHLITVGEK